MDLIDECLLLRCFAANREFVPPTWLMRQAGHHLAKTRPPSRRARVRPCGRECGTNSARSMMLAAEW